MLLCRCPHLGVRHEKREAETAGTRLDYPDGVQHVLLDLWNLGVGDAEEPCVIRPSALAAGPSLHSEQVVQQFANEAVVKKPAVGDREDQRQGIGQGMNATRRTY